MIVDHGSSAYQAESPGFSSHVQKLLRTFFPIVETGIPQVFLHITNCCYCWAGYIILYFLTENLIPAENCHPIHIWPDDVVPFCEWFVIPYVSWYLLIVGSLLYFALYSVDSFRNMQTYIIITQIIAMIVYIVYPNRQDLRPEVFPRDNYLTWVFGIIYTFDTNTGVCPSLHVGYSLGIASTWLREKTVPRWVRIGIAIWCGAICISVAFVKQHSVADIFAAIPMCLFAEWFVFFRKKQ